MTTFCYLNGSYSPLEEAKISPLDRGFLFGDGVYEVIPVYKNTIIGIDAHITRLNQSLEGIRMAPVHSIDEWKTILNTLVQKNKEADQWIYLQVSRGADLIRDHQFPKNVVATVFAVSHPKVWLPKSEQAKGIKATPIRDIRWKYCNIKTTARLAYVLMLQEAKDNGYDEGIIINNGLALEGTTSNLFIVRHGVVITPPKSSQILSGVTRDRVLHLAEKNKVPYRETKITERELEKADEIWITSAARGVYPVTHFNGNPVNQGQAGPVWDRMSDIYANELDNLSNTVSN